ncbi:MAG: ABC transporter permease [Cyclobacteriaceae bacterium]|nr:ABC transporter permease [Cyclobacteriaceae bacterium]
MSKIVVDAKRSAFRIDFRELFNYRDLFYVLAYRDLRVRYAQTFLGFLWALLQPLATLLIFVLVFGMAVKVDTGNIPYPLFAVSGIAMWAYFGFVLNQSGNSIIGAQEMIKKIYFPRLVVPLSKAVVGFVDFGVSLLMLVILMIVYGFTPSINILFAPLFMLLNIVAALSVGIWLGALTIRYRDFQHVIPFLVQFGMYATPVAYPARLVPEKYQLIYNLNPMAGVIQGFRWSVFGGNPPDVYFYISMAVIILLFISSLFYFKKVEDVMADIV